MKITLWNVSKTICHFHARTTVRRRKTWFHLRMGRISFAAKHGWTISCMSRPLFLGNYLQATWWASFRPMKKKKNLHRMIIRHIEFYSLDQFNDRCFSLFIFPAGYASRSSLVGHCVWTCLFRCGVHYSLGNCRSYYKLRATFRQGT